MKKFFAFVCACGIAFTSFAQQENNANYGELKGGFKQDHIFFGGSLSLGFYDRTFSIGANPQVGYTFAQWLDAGLGFNISYTSSRYTSLDGNTGNYYDVKQRLTSYGLGPFVRLYPVNFLFVQGQYEYNWTNLTEKSQSNGVPITGKQKVGAPSFIAGIGYTQRIVGQSSYFIMLGFDLLKRENSPYVGYDANGQPYAQPIFRTGFNFYLHPAKGSAREARYQSARIL